MSRKPRLLNGMVVETREGKRYIIVDNLMIGNTNYCTLSSYDEDFKYSTFSNLDIVKIYEKQRTLCCLSKDYGNTLKPIWERIEPKKLTVSEIEDLLGYPVEIVKESEE